MEALLTRVLPSIIPRLWREVTTSTSGESDIAGPLAYPASFIPWNLICFWWVHISLFSLSLTHAYLFLDFSWFHVCVFDNGRLRAPECRCPPSPEEGVRSPGNGATDGCEKPTGCWEPNPGPLQEWYSPLTAEPSLRILPVYLSYDVLWKNIVLWTYYEYFKVHQHGTSIELS